MTRLNYCYDCRQAHWAADCPKRNAVTQGVTQDATIHYTALRAAVEAMVPSSEKLNETWKKRRHCPTCHCNGKRVYKSAAERQRAYRLRHKAT